MLGRLPNTILLACASMLLSMLVSLPLGILAASYKGRLPDALSSTVALLGISMPSFWLGVILILVFAGGLRCCPPRAPAPGSISSCRPSPSAPSRRA